MIVHYQDGLSFYVCTEADRLVVIAINFEHKIHIVSDMTPEQKRELRVRIEEHVAKIHPILLPALRSALS